MAKSVANLSDVATLAKVSKSTVSRVLNNKLGKGFSVTTEVKERILKVIEELNYKPNLIAQDLTKQRTRMISVLGGAHALSDLGNIYQTVINSITNILDNAPGGFDVTVDMSHHPDGTSEIPAWRIDGAIVLARCSDETFEELEQRNVPYVVVNGASKQKGSSVVPDDIQGMKLAVEHLVKLGHKRIAYASAPLGHLIGHSSIEERHQTYISEIKKLGLPIIEGHDKLFTSAEDYLKSVIFQNKATAIIAYGHMNALNLMQAAHFLGISIPEKFSLLAFCDKGATDIMSPGLTFVDLQSKKMGEIAANMLLEMIKNPDSEKKKSKIQEQLVFRDTTSGPENK
jgi:DNA-binding LacI/PurR family transcriptional regulator